MRFVLYGIGFALLVALSGCGQNAQNEQMAPELVFGDGWYDLETNQTDTWRWVGDRAFVLLGETHSESESYILVFDALSLNERTLELKISNESASEYKLLANQWRKCALPLDGVDNDELLQFVSMEKGVRPDGDERELKFCIRNLVVVPSSEVGATFVRPEFGNGWYDLETDDSGSWRWSDSESSISIVNDFQTPQKVRVAFKARILSPRKISISFDGSEVSTLPIPKLGWHDFETELELKPGANSLEFLADAVGEIPAGDARMLSFCVSEFVVELK